MASGPTIQSAPQFLAFVRDEASLAATREAVAGKGWPEDCVMQGTIEDAIAHLQQHPTPGWLLVEIPEAENAPEWLDKLADSCSAFVRVIVTSTVNQYSFFTWLKDVGVHHYLLQPFTAAQLTEVLTLQEEVKKTAEDVKKQGKLFTFMGTRGGVGTTTILSNLAYLMQKEYKKNVGILDMDIHFGTAAMTFDIEPVRGLASLLENPDRVDSLSLDRVTATYTSNLHILSAEESLKNPVTTSAAAAKTLHALAQEKYEYIFVDLPRTLTPFTRHFLEQTDQAVLVTELTLLGLRDLLRISDYLKEFKKSPLIVANREGLASKHEMSKKDFEKHAGHPIPIHIPCMMEAFSTAASGEILIETTKNSAGLDALHQLARLVIGEKAASPTTETKKKLRLWQKDKA